MKEIQSTNSKALFEAGRDVLSNACIGYRCVYHVQHSLERLNSEPGLIYFPGATKVGPSYLLGDGHFSHGIDPLLESCLAFRECHATFDHWIVSNAQAVGEFGRNGWPLLFYWIQSIADEVCEHFGECRSCLEWETAETNKWLERQRLANDPPMGIPNDWFDYFFDENDRRALKAMMDHIGRLLWCLRSIELFTDDEPLIARWQLEYTNARSAEVLQPVVVENPFDPNAELSHQERLESARTEFEDIQAEILAYSFLKNTSDLKDVRRWGEDGFPMDRVPPVEDAKAKRLLERLRYRATRIEELLRSTAQGAHRGRAEADTGRGNDSSDPETPPDFDPFSKDWILGPDLGKAINLSSSVMNVYRKENGVLRYVDEKGGSWGKDRIGVFRNKVNRQRNVAYYVPSLDPLYLKRVQDYLYRNDGRGMGEAKENQASPKD